MANSRMLKELQSLAPWTWDKKCDTHPPGLKALHDFERVEHLQSWSRPPPSAKKAKLDKSKKPFELKGAENAHPNVGLSIYSEGQVLTSSAALQTPIVSRKSRDVRPDFNGLGVSLSPDLSEETDSPADSQAAVAPAMTPGVSLVTPQGEFVSRPVKASVMPRRLSMGLKSPPAVIKRKQSEMDLPEKVEVTRHPDTKVSAPVKKAQVTALASKVVGEAAQRKALAALSAKDKQKDQQRLADSKTRKPVGRNTLQAGRPEGNFADQMASHHRVPVLADTETKQAKPSAPDPRTGRPHEASQRVLITPKPSSQAAPMNVRASKESVGEVQQPAGVGTISTAPQSLWADKPLGAGEPTAVRVLADAIDTVRMPAAKSRAECSEISAQVTTGEVKIRSSASVQQTAQLGHQVGGTSALAREAVLPKTAPEAAREAIDPKRGGTGRDLCMETSQEAASSVPVMSQSRPGQTVLPAHEATEVLAAGSSLPPKAPFSDITNRPSPSDSLKLLMKVIPSCVSSPAPLATPKTINRERNGSAMASAFEMLREIDSRHGWSY